MRPRTLLNEAATALLAVMLLAAPAAAQNVRDHRTSDQAAPPSTPNVRDHRPGAGAVSGSTATVRYKVEALSIYAIDESGPDALGSDEIFAVLRTDQTWTRTDTLTDVDTGETHTFAANANCITPIGHRTNDQAYACNETGAVGPFSFTVELYESDSNNRILTAPLCTSGPSPCVLDGLIGERAMNFSAEQLLSLMPNPGDQYAESVRFGGPCGNSPPPCVAVGSGPYYLFTYRFTRLADQSAGIEARTGALAPTRTFKRTAPH